MYLCEDPEVGGRSASLLQMLNSSKQWSLLTLLRVRLLAVIFSKSNGPDNLTAVCVRSNSSVHCIYLPVGMTGGRKRTRSPYIISFVVLHLLYQYQSGHHRTNSSLLSLSVGC